MRARVSFLDKANVCYDVCFVVAAIVDIRIVMVCLVGTIDSIDHIFDCFINDDSYIVTVKTDRTHETADTAKVCDLRFACHVDLDAFHCVLYFYFVDFVVTAYKYENRTFFRRVSNSFDCFGNVDIKVLGNACDRFRIGRMYERYFAKLFRFCFDREEFSFFFVGSEITFVTVYDACFTRVSEYHEFVRAFTADRTTVCFNRTAFKTAATEDVFVRFVHFLIADIKACFIFVKRIQVFHDEFATTHQAETRAAFVAVFVLNLVEHERELTIRAHLRTNERRDHFFMRRAQAERTIMMISQTEHFFAVYVPTTRFLPKFCRLHDRHKEFLTAFGIHFFTDDIFYFFKYTPCKR